MKPLIAALMYTAFPLVAWASAPLFLRDPSVGATQIVCSYSTQLWLDARDGGIARQLTTGPGIKSHPFISPDGKWIAYTRQFGGISNIYLMAMSGGFPRRLTFSSFGFEE